MEAGGLVSIYIVYVSLVIYLYSSGKEVEQHIPDLYDHENSCSGGVQAEQLELLPRESDSLHNGSGPASPTMQRNSDYVVIESVSCSSFSVSGVGSFAFENFEKLFFFNRPIVEFLVPSLRPRRPHLQHNQAHETINAADNTPDVSLRRVACIFVACVTLIGFLSYFLLSLVEYALYFIPLDSSTISATLMALGSEVQFIIVGTF